MRFSKSICSSFYSYMNPHCLLAPSSHKDGSRDCATHLFSDLTGVERQASNFYPAA